MESRVKWLDFLFFLLLRLFFSPYTKCILSERVELPEQKAARPCAQFLIHSTDKEEHGLGSLRFQLVK